MGEHVNVECLCNNSCGGSGRKDSELSSLIPRSLHRFNFSCKSYSFLFLFLPFCANWKYGLLLFVLKLNCLCRVSNSYLQWWRPWQIHHFTGSGEYVESSKGETLVKEEQKTAEKVSLLKTKISSNAAAMPTVLKRMKECIARIEELDSYNGIIHPAFKKKRPSWLNHLY